jgi:hypothetical protein
MEYANRFWRAVRRLLAEVAWVRIEQRALEQLVGVKVIGLDFFRISHTALLGDRLLRMIRVFENSNAVASFWYLHRCAPSEFSGIDIDRLAAFSRRLKDVRDKTFVHIDKEAVFDPQAIYRAAQILPSEINWAVETVWNELKRLHAQRPSDEPEYELGEDYSGDDIEKLVALRDAARDRNATLMR